jgi:ABC-type antimicrobial peptide transport system permease subunit
MPVKLRLIIKSLSHYRKHILYQFLIISLLSAVITGSLLTGSSVRSSLKKSAGEHLGNTEFLISSGFRNFDPLLVTKLKQKGLDCTGISELSGSCRSFAEQKTTIKTNIIFASDDFFKFNRDPVVKSNGIAINRKLADKLNVEEGDELLIRFGTITDIPPDAPFAPSANEITSTVQKIDRIIDPNDGGNFSLLVSQIDPYNIFVPTGDYENLTGKSLRYNRILISRGENLTIDRIKQYLQTVLYPEAIGLNIRNVEGNQAEIISSRIFLDDALIKEIKALLPSSEPVLTYMANRIEMSDLVTPYSFVAGIPPSLYQFNQKNDIVINDWLSKDLNAKIGDSVKLYWYSPDSLDQLVDKNRYFTVKDVVEIRGMWADALLMPDFPGISARESCSSWDAGVPVNIKDIREKDEAYWKKYKGTPKAFISYETAKELWGSNFGTATSIRFSQPVSVDDAKEALNGKLRIDSGGFVVSDIFGESINAAENSVDFGSLFIGLGFFLIVASIVLLSFSVSYYLDSRASDIMIFHALGFKRNFIRGMLIIEVMVTGAAGSLLGSLAGYFVNIFVTAALNSVWIGAVQTDTLKPYFDLLPIISGFLITFILISIFIYLEAGKFLKRLHSGSKQIFNRSPYKAILPLVLILISASIFLVLSFLQGKNSVLFSFISGLLFFAVMILACRLYFVRTEKNSVSLNISRLYYRAFPSHAIAPVMFIAAGIFAFFITSVNRKSFSENMTDNSSGTGGYLFWCESGIPVSEDLQYDYGRKTEGFEDSVSLRFVMMKRSSGNDASCLNLNYITTPVLLGVDPADFISGNRFSFASVLKNHKAPWNLLNENPGGNIIYGVADQTVLQWGMKMTVGDTLVMRTEQGQPLKIIIAGGLKTSVFQGHVVIGRKNFEKYYPSVAGSSVMLVMGNQSASAYYSELLEDRLNLYDINIEKTTDRLSSFYRVTNTYLSVFGIMGGLGMITGIAGLGFVLLRNYNRRRREFAIMLAVGFTVKKIRKMMLSGQMLILVAGIATGIISAVIATLPSLISGQYIPWISIVTIVTGIFITGIVSVLVSLSSVRNKPLTETIRKEQ